MRRALPALLALALAGCTGPGAFVPRTDAVEARDTLEPLLKAARAAPDDRAAGEAWIAYLRQPDLALPADAELHRVRPESLGKALRAALPQLEATSAAWPDEARQVALEVGKLHGRSVAARLWLVALRDDAPSVAEQGRLLVNARSPAVADPRARRALLARALGAELLPSPGGLGPLARALYLEVLKDAGALAVAPDAPLPAFTGETEEASARLQARRPLLARELLASLDSAAPAQQDRFFGAASADPLVPRGAGALLARELGAAFIQELGSASAAVRLAPGEFRRHASRALERLASVP